MTYRHWFDTCPDHADCTRHVGEGVTDIDGQEHEYRTESHAPSDIDPAFRMNLDHPEAEDRRDGSAKNATVLWKLADEETVARSDFGWDQDDRARVAAAAVSKGLITAAAAAALGVTVS